MSGLVTGISCNGMSVSSAPEDLAELFGRDEIHRDLCLDATQARLVHHFGRIQVGREDDEEIKGDLDLLLRRGSGKNAKMHRSPMVFS